jgi:hypothetical protein
VPEESGQKAREAADSLELLPWKRLPGTQREGLNETWEFSKAYQEEMISDVANMNKRP